jgi:hypothetical protein
MHSVPSHIQPAFTRKARPKKQHPNAPPHTAPFKHQSKYKKQQLAHHNTNPALKNPSQGPALPFPPTRPFPFFMGLFSPIAPARVLTTLFSAKSSTGLFFTSSLHVGHVYTGRGPSVAARCCSICASSIGRSRAL